MPLTFETCVMVRTFVFGPSALAKASTSSPALFGSFGTGTRRTVSP